VATVRRNTTPRTVHQEPDRICLGNAPPAAASTKHGAANAQLGRTRWPKQGPRTSCGHATITLQRQQDGTLHRSCRHLPCEEADLARQLHPHSRCSSPGIDHKPDEDRRGQTLEPLSTHRIMRFRQHKQARAKDRIDRSYPAEEPWKRLETAPERHRTTAVITWSLTLITMHE
jgi:hypothetical protein